jgi:hypothetical protein
MNVYTFICGFLLILMTTIPMMIVYETDGDFLKSLPQDVEIFQILKFCFAICTLLLMPLYTHPARNTLSNLIYQRGTNTNLEFYGLSFFIITVCLLMALFSTNLKSFIITFSWLFVVYQMLPCFYFLHFFPNSKYIIFAYGILMFNFCMVFSAIHNSLQEFGIF